MHDLRQLGGGWLSGAMEDKVIHLHGVPDLAEAPLKIVLFDHFRPIANQLWRKPCIGGHIIEGGVPE